MVTRGYALNVYCVANHMHMDFDVMSVTSSEKYRPGGSSPLKGAMGEGLPHIPICVLPTKSDSRMCQL